MSKVPDRRLEGTTQPFEGSIIGQMLVNGEQIKPNNCIQLVIILLSTKMIL
jgi:hypothetical protein